METYYWKTLSHLDNLCITKRKINSAKCYRNETNFKT